MVKSARELIATSVFLLIGLSACVQTDRLSTASATPSVSITISAAASLQDALRDIQLAYQFTEPEVSITYNFGSSGSLAQQISQGAPVDVFLSASQQWMNQLIEQDQVVARSRKDLLKNSIVLVVPPSDTDIDSFQDIRKDEINRVAIGEPGSVPAGQYAKELLISLELYDAIESKLVYSKDVRQALIYVETGNADAAVVYATDAIKSNRVSIVDTASDKEHSPIVYPVAIVSRSENLGAAQAFVGFLFTEEAKTIFQEHGFQIAQ